VTEWSEVIRNVTAAPPPPPHSAPPRGRSARATAHATHATHTTHATHSTHATSSQEHPRVLRCCPSLGRQGAASAQMGADGGAGQGEPTVCSSSRMVRASIMASSRVPLPLPPGPPGAALASGPWPPIPAPWPPALGPLGLPPRACPTWRGARPAGGGRWAQLELAPPLPRLPCAASAVGGAHPSGGRRQRRG